MAIARALVKRPCLVIADEPTASLDSATADQVLELMRELLASTTEGALNALDVTVKGVFSSGVPDIDKRLVYTDIVTAQKLLNTQRVSTLGVFLKRMELTPAAQARVAAANPKLEVQTWLDQAAFYQAVRSLYDRIFGALGIIIGVIEVCVVTNAMAMAIIEHTRE